MMHKSYSQIKTDQFEELLQSESIQVDGGREADHRQYENLFFDGLLRILDFFRGSK